MNSATRGEINFPKTKCNHQLLQYILKHTDRGIMLTNHKNEIIYVNDRFLHITGFSLDDVIGKTPKMMQSGVQEPNFYEEMKKHLLEKGYWQGELWNRTKNGEMYLQELTIYVFKNDAGEIEHFIGFMKQLTNEGQALPTEGLDHHLFDHLTRLPNRVLLDKRLKSTLNLRKYHDGKALFFFFRIENFRQINADYGILFGDILLKRIIERLQDLLPRNSMLSRWQGMTFACVIESDEEVAVLKEQMVQRANLLTKPYRINDQKVQSKLHFGISICDQDQKLASVSSLLSNTKKALKQAIAEDKLLCFFEEGQLSANSFVVTEAEISRAIQEEEFRLYYQPLISTESKNLIGFEALIRWIHPEKGIIPPNEFIPFAEKTGLIQEIGAFVFTEACKQQVKWKEQGASDIIITVNFSMNQFQDERLLHFIKETIEKTGADPQRLSIELTESSFSEDKEKTVLKLKAIEKLGLSIAIDDFGTGYSSLSHLIDFPIHSIKIDRTFIQALESNKKIEAIVKTIHLLAKTLNLTVVAEGVESDTQFELVKLLEAQVVQGFLFDRPQPVETIEAKWLSHLVKD